MQNPPALSLFGLPSIPIRPEDGHKGTFGKVAVVGGSVGMSGAICLASVAALRSGSGLVTAAIPRSVQSTVAGFEPSIMTIALADDPESGLLTQSADELSRLIAGRDAIGVGPGLGRSPAAAQLTGLSLCQAALAPIATRRQPCRISWARALRGCAHSTA